MLIDATVFIAMENTCLIDRGKGRNYKVFRVPLVEKKKSRHAVRLQGNIKKKDGESNIFVVPFGTSTSVYR